MLRLSMLQRRTCSSASTTRRSWAITSGEQAILVLASLEQLHRLLGWNLPDALSAQQVSLSLGELLNQDPRDRSGLLGTLQLLPGADPEHVVVQHQGPAA